LDVRFWREGERTEFEVVRGDPRLIERRRMAAEFAGLGAGIGALGSILNQGG
jgi:hypothetical protein